MKVYWRKLFYRMTEKDQGSYQLAFIVYEKIPYLFQNRITGVGMMSRTVTQYQCFLRVDLGICQLAFNWRTKLLEENNLST